MPYGSSKSGLLRHGTRALARGVGGQGASARQRHRSGLFPPISRKCFYQDEKWRQAMLAKIPAPLRPAGGPRRRAAVFPCSGRRGLSRASTSISTAATWLPSEPSTGDSFPDHEDHRNPRLSGRPAAEGGPLQPGRTATSSSCSTPPWSPSETDAGITGYGEVLPARPGLSAGLCGGRARGLKELGAEAARPRSDAIWACSTGAWTRRMRGHPYVKSGDRRRLLGHPGQGGGAAGLYAAGRALRR